MTLVKWNQPRNGKYPAVLGTSFSPLFNEFFEDFLGGRSLAGTAARVPAVNVTENEDQFHVELAAPGLSKSDFNLNVEDNVLTVSVEKQEEKKDEEKGVTRREFNYTSFKRSFSLPESVNAEAIKAAYKDGILGIDIPKKEEEKAKNRVIKVS